MNSEIHKNIETFSDKQNVLFEPEELNFSKERNYNKNKLNKSNNQSIWKINDVSNEDQLKAVIGICFMLGSLLLMGLYSSLF